ncbi:MAG: OpgC domain-containing protein, partial [Pseudomonadota bacterium]
MSEAAFKPVPRIRDPRLDFFRGLAMFIIFIAHTPRDWWALWIPARFGFSDATEIFVFCSGMASAIAFGGVFARRGWWMGAARIAHRVWQVYWAHIGLFFAVLLLCIAFDQAGIFVSESWSKSYVGSLNLKHFFTKTPELVLGLFTLTYVPNYFDILPMYLVILALIPVVVGVHGVSPWVALSLVVGLWLVANAALFGFTPFNLPAEPWSERKWFFNPLGWQLVFFTGFAFMRGWIPAPPVNRRLVIAAIVVLLITIPFAYFRILREVP